MIRDDDDLFTDADLPGWYADAACREYPADWWFPDKGNSPERALDVCRSCPVRAACLAHALEEGTSEGIWGGTTPTTRQRLRRESRAA